MSDIRINQLPLATGGTAPVGSDSVAIDGATTRKTTITDFGNVAVPVASQAEAEAGANTVKRMSPLTTKQSISSEVGVSIASQANGLLASTSLQPSAIGVTVASYAQGVKADGSAQKTQNLADLADAAIARTNISAARLISSNTPISVPGDFATLDLALTSVANSVILPSISVTISVTGRLTSSATNILRGPFGNRIQIVGATPIPVAITGSTAGTGSAGSWSVTYTVATTAGLANGDVVDIGGTPSSLHRGAWKITALPGGNQVTVTNTTYATAPPSGQTGTMTVYPTQLFYTGVTGLNVDRAQISNVALVGDKTGSNTFGVLCKDRILGVQQGSVLLTNVIVNGFTAEGVRSNYGGVIHCNRVTSSNNGNNGFMARDLAQMTCDNACVASGNGFIVVAGGNNGFLCQNTSSMLLFTPNSIGNRGDGYFARSVASILIDNGSPGFASFNVNDYHVSNGSFMQAESCTSTSPTTAGFINDGGRMLIPGATSTNSGGNAISATEGGQTIATGVTISGATFNGFTVDGVGSKMNASSSNVVSVGGGNVAYRSANQGWMVMTSPLGLTSATPAANVGTGTPPTPAQGFMLN